MRALFICALTLSFVPPPTAYAQDDEFDDWLEDDDEGWEDDVPEKDEDDYGGDLDEAPEGGDEFNLFDDDELDAGPALGEDTADSYRAMLDQTEDMNAEDALLEWETYLEQYPNTVFMSQIERLLDELNTELYSGRIGGSGGIGGEVDALQQELNLIQPILLETIDPRSRIRAGFEIGFPEYLNLVLDGEYQIFREFSVHAGVRRRYTGWNGEAGAKYAIVKSARTNTIVTGLLDLHVNSNPLFPAVRPQIGVAKLLDVGGGLHLQAQGGVDMEIWGDSGGLQLRYVGGANAFYWASDTVGAFVETSINMKPTAEDQIGSFRFNVFTFGLRFFPGASPANIGVSANVPYTTNYWGYHFGAVQADLNYLLD